METVCFRLPGHGDTTLKHMNSLRFRQHFCDITIVASNNQTFKGHKVVLAACSPFLRDQFLLNPSSRLQVDENKHTLSHISLPIDIVQYGAYRGALQRGTREICATKEPHANVHSVASPLTTRPSPMEQCSPAVITLEEENSETSAQDSTQQNSDSPVLDEADIKVIFTTPSITSSNEIQMVTKPACN
ncbi:hypothetical protein GOODEAATRI_025585 [Goodea atripinnis]|uniref:BTB domain-containing protein n=1 Tax=Goodea atripinnis TaxID=208336 RepID=A0ABV0NXN2_9TELE